MRNCIFLVSGADPRNVGAQLRKGGAHAAKDSISDEVTNMSPPPLIEDILQPQEFVTNSDDVTTFSPTEGTAEESSLAYEEDNIVTSSQEPP